MSEDVKITVVTTVVKIQFDCPHCRDGIEIAYKEFCGIVGEYCDWHDSDFECPNCEKQITIDEIDWD